MKMKMFDISGRKPRQIWEKNGDVDISRDNSRSINRKSLETHSTTSTEFPRFPTTVVSGNLQTVDTNQMSSSTREFANSVQYNMFGRIQYSNSKCGNCGK